MVKLTAEDCRHLLAIISNARITGADAGVVAALQNKLQEIGAHEQRKFMRENDPDIYGSQGSNE